MSDERRGRFMRELEGHLPPFLHSRRWRLAVLLALLALAVAYALWAAPW